MTSASNRDGLKALDEITKPDSRNSHYVLYDQQTGEHRAITLSDHYKRVEQHALHKGIPDNIATQFDVSRNLYLYAWYEYRFFNVAEANVLTVLEFALKERVGKENIKAYIKDRNRQVGEKTGKKGNVQKGMKTLIEYCRDYELIRNTGFSAWHRQPRMQAEAELRFATLEAMRETGEDTRELDYGSLEYPEPSDDYDHIQHLINHTNKIRNLYAHGTSMLHNNVLYSFEMVSEFINQLYPEQDATNE